jgi:hypothetical protein
MATTNHTDNPRMSQILLSRNMLLIAAAVAIAAAYPDILIVPDENTAWLFDVRYIPNPALDRLAVYVADLEITIHLLIADLQTTHVAAVPRNTMQPLHTLSNPFCQHPDCGCKDNHVLVQRYVMQPLESHLVNGAEAMRRYWGQVEVS